MRRMRRTVDTDRRRVRVRRCTVDTSTDDEISDLISQVVDCMRRVESENLKMRKLMSVLDTTMQQAKVTTYSCSKGDAMYQTPASRSTVTIDPLKFYKLVGFDEFLDAVTVPVNAAKKVLGGKELEGVSTVSKPKRKEPVLTVHPSKV